MTTLVPARPADGVDVERPGEALAVAGVLGLAFQWLFWGAAPGLSVPVFVGLVVAAVWWTAGRQGARATRSSVALAAVAVLLAGGVAVRAGPLTTLVNLVVVLGLLAVLVHAFGSDRWLTYGFRVWARAVVGLFGHEVVGAPRLAVTAVTRAAGDGRSRRTLDRVIPLARGIVLAVPVLAVLGVLLVSADAVFSARVAELTRVLPRPGETVARTVLALAVAYVMAGGLWHLSQRSRHDGASDQPVRRVLGFSEAVTVLASVNVLLGGFVAIQLRYFFGGHDALLAEGLTYAEYARRGFGELVAVAAIGLALHLALAGLTRRETRARRWALAALGAMLTALMLVILVSAFQRLLLYEDAFGFTRLRIVVHVFMVWLGLLLVCVLALQLAERVRMFVLAGMVAVVGFAATLNVIGVDALIAQHNVARAAHGAELDTAYLQQLSADAVPELVKATAERDPPLADEVAAVVSCWADRHDDGGWRSLTLGDLRARATLDAIPADRRVPCPRPTPSRRAAPPAPEAAEPRGSPPPERSRLRE